MSSATAESAGPASDCVSVRSGRGSACRSMLNKAREYGLDNLAPLFDSRQFEELGFSVNHTRQAILQRV